MLSTNEEKKIYNAAVKNGCRPFWYNGILGHGWHCDCEDARHWCDPQCSAITLESAENNRIKFDFDIGGEA